MNIAVIIVTYNAANWIEPCFKSLQGNSIHFKTIVIDNASSDATVVILKKDFPEVELICSEINLGFGAANNIGIKKAYDEGADFVFLLNQDATVERDTIQKTCAIHQQNFEYGIISPMQYADSGSCVDGKFLNYISEKKYNVMLSDIIANRELKSVYPFRFINAAVWSISRKCIEEVGGFDSLFFHYGEDFDYCQRVHEKGYKIGVAPEVASYHNRVQNFNVSNEMKLKLQYNHYLYNLKSMKHSLNLALFKQVLRSMKVVLVSLFKGNFTAAFYVIRFNFNTILNYHLISLSRKMSTKKLAFLQ
jgi:GT2 family glycosyltransferase